MKNKFSNYLVFIITVVLALFAAGMIFFVNTSNTALFKSVLDAQVQRELDSSVGAFSSGLPFLLDNDFALQFEIEHFARSVSRVKEVNVLLPQDGNFKVLASSKKDLIGTVVNRSDLNAVWSSNNAQALYEPANSVIDGQRIVHYVTPIKSLNAQTKALVSIDFFPFDLPITNLERSLTMTSILLGLLVIVIVVTLGALLDRGIKTSSHLDEQVRSADALLNAASSEITSTLTTIRGSLAIVIDELGEKITKEQKNLLEKAEVSTEELVDLMEDLIVVSRFEKKRTNVYPRPYHLDELTSHMVDIFQSQAKKKGIDLSYEPHNKSLPRLVFDPELIREVLHNYLSNAVRYTQKGSVRVFFEHKPKSIVLKVEDTGPGISEADVKKLFNRFVRLNETSRMARGSGLGLYISRLIIEKHKGKVWVESKKGKGSVFAFSLPIGPHETKN